MKESARKIIEQKIGLLSKSKFRSRFRLNDKERRMIENYGIDKIRSHAKDFVLKKLVFYDEKKDGKQTPMRNHPVFIAQHATATCCRGCIEKWYKIPKGKELSLNEQNFIVELIMEWININYNR
ncbi:MAG: DUF4186 domain-containing protein [Bacilli bacterium]|nr:DUF4186 domain-containing protein [Bacilli bacterium]